MNDLWDLKWWVEKKHRGKILFVWRGGEKLEAKRGVFCGVYCVLLRFGSSPEIGGCVGSLDCSVGLICLFVCICKKKTMADQQQVVRNQEEEEEANRLLLEYSVSGDAKGLERVLQEGKVYVDGQSQYGYTGLIYASWYGRVECLKLLLAANANVNAQDQFGNTGLILASTYGRVECLKLLLAANANVNSQNEYGDTGLILASQFGLVECLKILLENNASVNHHNVDNRTALTACCSGYDTLETNKRVMQFLLLSCGAEGEEGKESLTEMNTRITEYHTELKTVLEKEVIVDTRLYLEEHGLYHEPLERVMQYCGLELMLENDSNREETDPIPVLLRGRTRASSAMYWWNLLH